MTSVNEAVNYALFKSQRSMGGKTGCPKSLSGEHSWVPHSNGLKCQMCGYINRR